MAPDEPAYGPLPNKISSSLQARLPGLHSFDVFSGRAGNPQQARLLGLCRMATNANCSSLAPGFMARAPVPQARLQPKTTFSSCLKISDFRETQAGYHPYPPPPRPPAFEGGKEEGFHFFRLLKPSDTPPKVGGFRDYTGIVFPSSSLELCRDDTRSMFVPLFPTKHQQASVFVAVFTASRVLFWGEGVGLS